jgi:ketosteroid isomerase-like protein
MSQENVEIVRAAFDRFSSRGLEGVLEIYASDIEWWDRADDPEAGVHRGHYGVRDAFAALDDFTEFRIKPEELIDAGEYVVAPVRITGRGRSSGVPFDEREVHVFRLRDGKVVELREYGSRSEALEAVGLDDIDAGGTDAERFTQERQ